MRDDERRVLAEIEDDLRAGDPAFHARMAVPDPRPFPAVAVLAVLWCITAPLVSLLWGPAELAVMTSTVFGIATIVVIRRRREQRGPHRRRSRLG